MATEDRVTSGASVRPNQSRVRKRVLIAVATVASLVLALSWLVPALAAREWMYLVRLYALMPLVVVAFAFAASGGLVTRLRNGVPSVSRLLRVMALLLVGAVAVLAIGVVVVTGRSPLSSVSLLFLPWALLWPVGMAFILHGAPRRVGEERYCPACGYRYGYAGEDDADGPDTCSECGCAWKGRLVRGRLRTSYPSLIVGFFVLCGAVFGIGPWMIWMHRLVPPGVVRLFLQNETPKSGFWTSDAAKALPAEDVRAIVDRVLIDRRKTCAWGTRALWLGEQSERMVLRQDQIDAIMAINNESLSVTAAPPVSVRIARGEDIAWMGLLEKFYFAGFRVDGEDWTWLPRTAISAREVSAQPSGSRGGVTLRLPGEWQRYEGKKVTLRFFQFAYAVGPEKGIPSIVNGELTSPSQPLYLKRHEFEVEFPAVGPGVESPAPNRP